MTVLSKINSENIVLGAVVDKVKDMNEALFDDFIQAQNTVYPSVITELTEGQKRTHWMWFIFPQVKGLGRSNMSRRFAIESLEQAKEYLQHDVLGVRLREC